MGPLRGLRIIELAGIGPAPFAAMMLADHGADVVRIDRPGSGAAPSPGSGGFLARGRRSLCLDLKQTEAVETVLELVARADALIEGFRPGVMERLGIGPEPCLARNPRLVYGRVTGWGREGPLAAMAGHDLNYISLTGAQHAIGSAAQPLPPLNLLGDFGGGGLLLAFGLVSALLEARSSGRGQVVDAAMTDGSALLMAMTYGMRAAGTWSDTRASNLVDGGAPFYCTYACADGRWVAVAAIEDRFHDALLDGLGLPRAEFAGRWDRSEWPRLRERLAAVFRTAARDAWCERFTGTDACVTPVLDLEEAPRHPHNRARATFRLDRGAPEPAPAPRYSRTATVLGAPAPRSGERGVELLLDWGIPIERIEALRAAKIL